MMGQQLLFIWKFSRFFKQTDNKQVNEHKAAIALALILNSKLGGLLGEAEPIQKLASGRPAASHLQLLCKAFSGDSSATNMFR